MSHEPLLTSVVGSHAHPGWFAHAIAAAARAMSVELATMPSAGDVADELARRYA